MERSRGVRVRGGEWVRELLILGRQLEVLGRELEAQGVGAQRVDHVLVAFTAVLE